MGSAFPPRSSSIFISALLTFHEFLSTAHLLEDQNILKSTILSLSAHSQQQQSTYPTHPVIGRLLDFYSRPEIHPGQIKFSSQSLTSQLCDPEYQTLSKSSSKLNYYSSLSNFPDTDMDNMTEDMDMTTEETTFFQANQPNTQWHIDSDVKSISEDFFSHLKQAKQKSADSGELDWEVPKYKHPEDPITVEKGISQ